MKIEVPYSSPGEDSPPSPETTSPRASRKITPKSSPDTTPSPSPSPSSDRPRPPKMAAPATSSSKGHKSLQPSVEDSTDTTDSDTEPGIIPFEIQFAHCMSLGYPDEDYYSSRYPIRLSSGYWLANGISLDQVVGSIPVVGYVNEYDQPIPSLDGPDIHLTLATIDTITHVGEENDWNSMLDLGQVFYLFGPRKGQLNDAYAWIALRGNDSDKFIMSRRARNRLVPNWKALVKDWEDFDEAITSPFHELRKVAMRAKDQALHFTEVMCAQKGIDLIDTNMEDFVAGKLKESHSAARLVTACHRILITATSFEEATERMQALVDKLDV